MEHPSAVEQFQKEHPDAEACPNCGYRYYVGCPNRIALAYEDGDCRVCYGDSDFSHKSQSSVSCQSPNQIMRDESE